MSGLTTTSNEVTDDFRNFLYVVWTEALRLPTPAPIQYDIAYQLQHGWKASADGITRIQLQAARGFGKTYILCAWMVWNLLRNPDIKILMISMNTNRAKEAIRLVRQIISGCSICHHLVPFEGQRDGADRIDVGTITRPAKDPSIAAYGVTSAVAGTHPDIIIADDTETKENSGTAAARERLIAAYYEFESMVQPGGTIIHMGTPQSGDSVYNSLISSYSLKRYPCRYPRLDDDDACRHIAPWMIERVASHEAVPDEPTYPERFGEEALAEKLGIFGPYHFALQMMLDTKLADSDRYPLKARDLVVMATHPELAPTNVIWGQTNPIKHIICKGLGNDDTFYGPDFCEEAYSEYKKCLMWIDPSGGGDDVGYAVLKGLNGLIYLVAAGGLPGGHSDATLIKLSKIALEHGVKHVLVETNFGDGLYEKALAQHMHKIAGPCKIEGRVAKGQKEARICDVLEPVVNSHRLVVDQRVAKNADFVYQFTHITRDRGSLSKDDIIDAIGGGVAEFVDMIGMDPAKQEQRRQVAELEDMVKEFSKGFQTGNIRKGWGGQALDLTHAPRPTRLPRRVTQWGNSSRWGR